MTTYIVQVVANVVVEANSIEAAKRTAVDYVADRDEIIHTHVNTVTETNYMEEV